MRSISQRGRFLMAASVVLAGALALVGCAGPDVAGTAQETSPPTMTRTDLLDIRAEGERLRAASCPDDVRFAMATAFEFEAQPVELGGSADLSDRVRYVGGWHIRPSDARVGGLSGMVVLNAGNLLTVTDDGHFVWLGMDTLTGMPSGQGRITPMLDAEGRAFDGKEFGDSEGLARTEDGLILVSFEQEFRVLAYDLEGCGATARGAVVSQFGRRPQGLSKEVGRNSGPEALAIGPGGDILIGLEENDGDSPFGRVSKDGGAAFTARMKTPGLLSLTGMDVSRGRIYSVHRFYAPGVGNRISVQETTIGSDGNPEAASRRLIYLEPPGTVDNFEGIAVADNADGSRRIFLLSDDNFSSGQRTLLLAFDLVD